MYKLWFVLFIKICWWWAYSASVESESQSVESSFSYMRSKTKGQHTSKLCCCALFIFRICRHISEHLMAAAQHSFHIVFIFLHSSEFYCSVNYFLIIKLLCTILYSYYIVGLICTICTYIDIDVLRLAFHRSSTLFCILCLDGGVWPAEQQAYKYNINSRRDWRYLFNQPFFFYSTSCCTLYSIAITLFHGLPSHGRPL